MTYKVFTIYHNESKDNLRIVARTKTAINAAIKDGLINVSGKHRIEQTSLFKIIKIVLEVSNKDGHAVIEYINHLQDGEIIICCALI